LVVKSSGARSESGEESIVKLNVLQELGDDVAGSKAGGMEVSSLMW
jgi:hypothetical protein